MKNITFLSTLLATTFLAGNALADIDCSQYYSGCNSGSGTCTCSQNDNGTVNLAWVASNGAGRYDYVYSENKQVLEVQQSSYYRGNLETKTIDKHTYDDLGRLTEQTIMAYGYAYGYTDNISRYTRSIYQYNSDNSNDYIYSSYTVNGGQSGGNGSVDITYNNESFRLKDSIILSNANIEEVKKLVNEGDLDKLVAYTGGQLDYYRTMDPNKRGTPTKIKTNDLGFSYLPIEYYDSLNGYAQVYEIPEMFVQNEDGSISVYDISAATAGLSKNELNAFIQNADPKDITGATLKGKYDSVAQYMLHGVLGYNASGSDDEDDASYKQKNPDGSVAYYTGDGKLKTIRGKKIYTVQEAEEITKNGTKFRVGLTYK